jgi:hypothetical protein
VGVVTATEKRKRGCCYFFFDQVEKRKERPASRTPGFRRFG